MYLELYLRGNHGLCMSWPECTLSTHTFSHSPTEPVLQTCTLVFLFEQPSDSRTIKELNHKWPIKHKSSDVSFRFDSWFYHWLFDSSQCSKSLEYVFFVYLSPTIFSHSNKHGPLDFPPSLVGHTLCPGHCGITPQIPCQKTMFAHLCPPPIGWEFCLDIQVNQSEGGSKSSEV